MQAWKARCESSSGRQEGSSPSSGACRTLAPTGAGRGGDGIPHEPLPTSKIIPIHPDGAMRTWDGPEHKRRTHFLLGGGRGGVQIMGRPGHSAERADRSRCIGLAGASKTGGEAGGGGGQHVGEGERGET